MLDDKHRNIGATAAMMIQLNYNPYRNSLGGFETGIVAMFKEESAGCDHKNGSKCKRLGEIECDIKICPLGALVNDELVDIADSIDPEEPPPFKFDL